MGFSGELYPPPKKIQGTPTYRSEGLMNKKKTGGMLMLQISVCDDNIESCPIWHSSSIYTEHQKI
jgi:hypothetical protein